MKVAELMEALLDVEPDLEPDDFSWDDEEPETGVERTYLFFPGDREGRFIRLRKYLRHFNAKFDISEPDQTGMCRVVVDTPIRNHERLITHDLVDGLIFENGYVRL